MSNIPSPPRNSDDAQKIRPGRLSALRAPAQDPQHEYIHTVYQSRYRQFKRVRLLSLVVGGSILVLLSLGMWQLYRMVFSTITDTEHLFLLSPTHATSVIQFRTLDTVRSLYTAKQSILPLPAPDSPFHTSSPTISTLSL